MEHTIRGATETSEGRIVHHSHESGIYLPVVLDINGGGVKKMMELQKPLRDYAGNLVYALPGGGNYVP